jgi:hypothetical protein
MYLHERSLVKKLEAKPFALIGIDSDLDREQLKKVLAKQGITWRSFWNGGGICGPISTAWNVHDWPTLYVLDHKGGHPPQVRWLAGRRGTRRSHRETRQTSGERVAVGRQ